MKKIIGYVILICLAVACAWALISIAGVKAFIVAIGTTLAFVAIVSLGVILIMED